MDEHWDQRRDSLAARLKDGNREAADELVDIYYEQIYLFMRRLGHSCQASEDLTQESFLQAWRRIGQLRDGKALNGWLYRIAGNASKMYRRRHKGKDTISLTEIEAPDSKDSVSDKIVDLEHLRRLNKAVGELPKKFKQAVILHYMQHLTIAEAAEAAGVRKNAFKSRLNRALETLREQIGE